MPYFGRQGQFENQATRQLSGLHLHQGYEGHSKPPGEVQVKPYEAIKNAASRHLLGIPLVKVSEWIFYETETCDSILGLYIQNIKYLTHLEKNVCLSQRNFI